ncbi:MAG: hypothetical protein ACLVG5_02215 [Clostridium sp.]
MVCLAEIFMQSWQSSFPRSPVDGYACALRISGERSGKSCGSKGRLHYAEIMEGLFHKTRRSIPDHARAFSKGRYCGKAEDTDCGKKL